LTERLLTAFSIREQIERVPKFLQFPILSAQDGLEAQEFMNPFEFLESSGKLRTDQSPIADDSLNVLLREATSAEGGARRGAVTTLGVLHDLGLLDGVGAAQFGAVLWSQRGEDGLPSGTTYFRHAFLKLPHPADIDPVVPYMDYIRTAAFPIQGKEREVTVGIGESGVPLCRAINAADDMEWTRDDVRSVGRRLVAWWDADKEHFRKYVANPERSGPLSVAPAIRRRVSDLVITLGLMVARHVDAMRDEVLAEELMRATEELGECGVPVRRLEMACSLLRPAFQEAVVRRIEEDLTCAEEDVVTDGLEGMQILSEYAARESNMRPGEKEHLARLVAAAAHVIRWRRDIVVAKTIHAVVDVVTKHAWTLTASCERSLLLGLSRLLRDTAVRRRSRSTRTGGEGVDGRVAVRLVVRRAAARLAHWMFEQYRKRDGETPREVEMWKTACLSDEEFAEVRNQWIGLPAMETTAAAVADAQ